MQPVPEALIRNCLLLLQSILLQISSLASSGVPRSRRRAEVVFVHNCFLHQEENLLLLKLQQFLYFHSVLRNATVSVHGNQLL